MRRWTREEDLTLIGSKTDKEMVSNFPDLNIATLQRRRRMLRAQPSLSDGVSLGITGLEATSFDPKNFHAIVLGDIQSPFHDRLSIRSVNNLLVYLKNNSRLDVLINNGDHFDNYAISRFDKSKLRGEASSFRKEVEVGTEIFAEWRRSLGDDLDIILHMGNHEDRWAHFLEQNVPDQVYAVAGDSLDFAKIYGLDSLGVQLIPYKRPVIYGEYVITHNTKSNQAQPGTTVLNLIRKKYGQSLIVNHIHTGAMVTQRYVGGTYVGIENFSLADFDQLDYAEFPNWCQGFTYLVTRDGVSYAHPVPIINHCFEFDGKIFSPEGII